MTQKQNISAAHNLFIYDSSKLTVTGIKNVASFDENVITALLVNDSLLTIEGTGLNIMALELEKGCIEVECTEVSGVFYSCNAQTKRGFFSRLVKGQ